MSKTTRLRIASEADVARSLMEASRIARDMGFNPHDAQTVATAVSELARNIIKYAGTGEIAIDQTGTDRQAAIQITARDRGPGIADTEAAMRDHFSSGGTLGLGLPGVKRMMDDFELDSAPGRGTRVVVRKWREPRKLPFKSVLRDAANRTLQVKRFGEGQTGGLKNGEKDRSSDVDCGFFVRPCRGERVSGDTAVVEQRDHLILLAIIDGLGHGKQAHHIAKRAESFLRTSWRSEVVSTILALHDALKDTEGAAAGICVVDIATGDLKYTGVGNTVIRAFGSRENRLMSAPGTLGHQLRTPQEHRLHLEAGDVLVLYTDGIKERFELTDYPQLRYQSARTVARTIVERFGKPHDLSLIHI